MCESGLLYKLRLEGKQSQNEVLQTGGWPCRNLTAIFPVEGAFVMTAILSIQTLHNEEGSL